MATAPDGGKVLKLSVDAQKYVINFYSAIIAKHNANNSDLNNKMDAIDTAYARYVAGERELSSDGVDRVRNTGCDIFARDNIIPPIVVSQVDSYVAYLADVFLSGSPIFPVVSSPSKRQFADQLETLLDDHSLLGGYPRQLLMFLRDAVKYNYAAIEIEWDEIDQFSAIADFTNQINGTRVNRDTKYFNRIRRLDPRNVIRDSDISPGDVSEHGDYAGYLEVLSRTKLKKFLNKLSLQNKAYNIDKAFMSGASASTASNFRDAPQISNYVNSNHLGTHGVDWEKYFDPLGTSKVSTNTGTSYLKATIYARILPSEFGITAPQKNTPQIWKFIVINDTVLVSAERIISAYDYLPILFGQPLEDGLGYQTQSVAEGEIVFQDAAATLFGIRFAAARRSVSDRALYLADMIDPAAVNSKAAAPKIPVNISALSSKGIRDAYFPIPFDMRGTETTIQDAATIVGFSKDLHGLNNPQQGQFQKGNKSVTEFNTTMAGSENRLRLPAMTLEHQVFSPLKSMLALNIFQFGENSILISQKTGEEVNININELRKQVLSFKLADGFTPKSKLASTEMLTQGLQIISQIPQLQQAYGASLPALFAHIMSLGGVKGLEEYSPDFQQQVQPPQGLQDNTLQQPPTPQAIQQPNIQQQALQQVQQPATALPTLPPP